MAKKIIEHIVKVREDKRKLLAVLIDPDTPSEAELEKLCAQINQGYGDLIFLGGSLLTSDALDSCISKLKKLTTVPVILFPGSALQVSDQADAILFLSLISGRNPDLLIGTHVVAAPYVKQAGLETLATGYMLVDSGRPTTASYMSNSHPIPHDKPAIAACTAMAGEMLGLKLMYLDGGSGAQNPVSAEMIKAVRQAVDTPIIVGGGIRSAQKATELCEAGADIVVVGHASEENPQILKEISEAIHHAKPTPHLG